MYFKIMIESLEKKIAVLDKILVENNKQKELFGKDDFDEEALKETFDKKSELIDELSALDDGFKEVYDRIKYELAQNKEKYASEVKKMQELIKIITDKSMDIEAQEKRNHLLAQSYFMSLKKNIKKSKTNLKAASKYYKSVSQTNYVDAQFMDRRK